MAATYNGRHALLEENCIFFWVASRNHLIQGDFVELDLLALLHVRADNIWITHYLHTPLTVDLAVGSVRMLQGIMAQTTYQTAYSKHLV